MGADNSLQSTISSFYYSIGYAGVKYSSKLLRMSYFLRSLGSAMNEPSTYTGSGAIIESSADPLVFKETE